MDKIVGVLINWQAFLVAFASFALVGTIRAIGTKKDKDGKVTGGFAQNRWFQMFLPLYPYLLTMGAVFAPGLPLPAELSKSLVVKLLFGLWTGWLSGFSYQLLKKVLEKGFGVEFDTAPTPRADQALPSPSKSDQPPTP